MSLAGLGRPEDNAALRDLILKKIRAEGPLTFAEFMGLALYHSELGYYRTCDPSLDFQTSPEVHPVFGAVVGHALAGMWRLLDRPAPFTVFEAGAGSGRLCGDILRWAKSTEPEFYDSVAYVLCDPRLPDMAALGSKLGAIIEQVRVAGALPLDASITGCIVSNELLDALPFHRVKGAEHGVEEILVGEEDGELSSEAGPPGPALREYFEALGARPVAGCLGEANLNAADWIGKAGRSLARGYVLTFDYGYAAQELYAPWRSDGTLLTFYRMTSGDNPYVRIGRQDITASVDFTAAQRAGELVGLRTLGRRRQSEFLAEAVKMTQLGDSTTRDLEGFLSLRRALQVLSEPWGLGRIEVQLQAKRAPGALPAGFEAPS